MAKLYYGGTIITMEGRDECAEALVVKDGLIEHYMNGVKVLEVNRYSYVFDVLKSLSKFKDDEKFGQFEDGHLLITDHSDKVMFKNLKINEL